MNSPEAASPASTRSNPTAELRETALDQFASVGFAGTSLQHIADAAGYSKSSVLYHFASKEALLESVLEPAIEALRAVLERYVSAKRVAGSREVFVAEFIDFVLEHRREVHVIINQGSSLRDVPVVRRANELVVGLATSVCAPDASTEERMRFAVALGGAAYALVAEFTFGEVEFAVADSEPVSLESLRAALLTIVSELIAPINTRLAE